MNTTYPSPIAESIELWRAKKITGVNLMRSLASYPEWRVGVSEAAAVDMMAHNDPPRLQIHTAPDGKKCLCFFSSSEAFDVYRKASHETGKKQHFLTVPGTWTFRLPMDGIEQIHIDPMSPYDIFYSQEHFTRLKEMADAVEMEDLLLRLRKGTAPDGALRKAKEYKNYYMAVYSHEGKPAFMMAPDSNGRTLAAVFTADDTFDAFKAQTEMSVGGMRVQTVAIQQMQMDGPALYDTLARMSIDGFVFNCFGPVTPVAFAKAVAGLMLEA
jgi:hypothetical protein